MGKYQTITYEIADTKLRIDTLWREERSKAFTPFVVQTEECDWHIIFRPVEKMEEIKQQPLFYNDTFKVCKTTEGIYIRQYCNKKYGGRVYASVYSDAKAKRVLVEYFSESVEWHFGSAKLDFFYITLEKILIEENALIMHAACVDTPYGGVLFSGISGVGKSTQAELWCQYGQGRLINGDRPIIKNTPDGWKAYGSPYAGSSGCHLSESCRIRAIVFPQKSDICVLRKISGHEKFRKVFSNLTLNMWDAEFVKKAGDLTQQLISEIPVYELQCTMEKDAVLVLQELFEKEGEQWNREK